MNDENHEYKVVIACTNCDSAMVYYLNLPFTDKEAVLDEARVQVKAMRDNGYDCPFCNHPLLEIKRITFTAED